MLTPPVNAETVLTRTPVFPAEIVPLLLTPPVKDEQFATLVAPVVTPAPTVTGPGGQAAHAALSAASAAATETEANNSRRRLAEGDLIETATDIKPPKNRAEPQNPHSAQASICAEPPTLPCRAGGAETV